MKTDNPRTKLIFLPAYKKQHQNRASRFCLPRGGG